MPGPPSVQVSTASLESLEFPQVLALVAALASTDVGRSGVLSLEPVVGERLEHRRRALEEIEGMLAEGLLVQPLDESVAELVEELAASRPELGGRKLLRWKVVLETAKAAIDGVNEDRPHLYDIVRDAPDLGWLVQRISETLDARGEVRDDASPLLLRLRRRIGGLRKAAYDHLYHVLADQGELFSDDTTPLHNGRLVLMLRAGDRNRMEGLVHGRSASGRSLYFEPLSAVASNNDLQEAVTEEEVERRRLLRQLAEELLGARQQIEATTEVMARLDTLQAAWRFGETVGGRLAEISDGDLVLVAARHPLLASETRDLRRAVLGSGGHEGGVTALDLELLGDQRVLVVTGPNAGGKTVALKTVGLVMLLTLCGLPVPVMAGSRIPEVTHLVGVVGDEQDLMQDRSTFSGRLQRLREAWQAAGPEAFVLLDELGSGTDPEEGAALSVALVEHLVARGAGSIVTTHLMPVASAAAAISGAVCASMEFDRDTHSPTFRLILGPPGGSEAIALARQLELPEQWLTRAESLVGEEHGKLQRLLADVESTRAELEAEREALGRLRQEAAGERQSLAAQRQGLEQDRRRLGARMKRDLDTFRRRVRERMDEEVATLREELAAGRKRNVTRRTVDRLFEQAPEFEPEDGETAEPIGLGARVRHTEHAWTGRLEKLEGDEATVSVQGKRVRCAVRQLRPLPAEAPKRGPRVEVSHQSADVPIELDLVGQRVEPALQELDRYLDRALLVPHREVRIVHGHGSGRLRRAVRDYLADHIAVAASRPGRSHEGGDGATVVRLGS